MNKLEKAIAKLSKEYRATFDFLAYKLLVRNFLGLKIAKLKGQKNIFRLKHGRMRIIFRKDAELLELLDVGLRDENTYRKF